jgi:nucleotide-binding universal stress UspA family protein
MSQRVALPHLGSRLIQLKKILVPIDFSTASEIALSKAVMLATHFGAEIILEHVVEADPLHLAHRRMPDQVRAAEPVEVLARFGRQHIPSNISRQITVRVGRPSKAIADTAKAMQADLIIITSHSHSILNWALLGSTAERVVRHAACAVWTVRG